LHHARRVMFTETRCNGSLLLAGIEVEPFA
jgi:hypothetical protein